MEPDEFAQRVVYAALVPAVRLAGALGLRLKQLSTLLQLAQLRERGGVDKSQRDLADELGVSLRTLARLTELARGNFFDPEQEHELPRKIEFLLWTGPKSEARIQQLLPRVSGTRINTALQTLSDQGRVRLKKGRTPVYEETSTTHRLTDDKLAARLDGVSDFASVVFDTIHRRFVRTDDRAFARTVGLRVRVEDIPKLRELYEQTLWPRLVKFDEAARNGEEVVEMGLAYCFSPRTVDEVEQGDPT